MSCYADTTLAEYWIVRPLGDATPANKRGRKFDLSDHEGARACYLAAVAEGHAPKITRYTKWVTPCSRTPQRHEQPVHVDRLGTDLSGRRVWLMNRPLDWPTFRSVHVTLGGGRLSAAGVHDATSIVDGVRTLVYGAQPFADHLVEIAGTDPRYPAPCPLATGPMTHTYVVVRADGTTGTQDDDDVRAVIGDAIMGATWWVEGDYHRRMGIPVPAPR